MFRGQRKMLTKVLMGLVTCFVFLNITTISLSNGNDKLSLPDPRIHPGTIYYPVKRLFEKFVTSLKLTSQSKINYSEFLLKLRLSELEYVVDNKLLGEVETSSQRVSYQASVLSDLAKDSQEDKKKRIKQELKTFATYLNDLRDKYPANSSFWLLIQHSINSLNSYSENLR